MYRFIVTGKLAVWLLEIIPIHEYNVSIFVK